MIPEDIIESRFGFSIFNQSVFSMLKICPDINSKASSSPWIIKHSWWWWRWWWWSWRWWWIIFLESPILSVSLDTPKGPITVIRSSICIWQLWKFFINKRFVTKHKFIFTCQPASVWAFIIWELIGMCITNWTKVGWYIIMANCNHHLHHHRPEGKKVKQGICIRFPISTYFLQWPAMMMVAAMYNDDKEEEVTLRVFDFLI